MKRRRRTAEHRERICEARGWLCHLCGFKIDPRRETFHLDHVIALAAGGSDEDDNLSPVHAKCHLEKTVKDVKAIAKGKRVRAQLMGTKRKSSKPMPFGRFSPWKKKLNGEVVPR